MLLLRLVRTGRLVAPQPAPVPAAGDLRCGAGAVAGRPTILGPSDPESHTVVPLEGRDVHDTRTDRPLASAPLPAVG